MSTEAIRDVASRSEALSGAAGSATIGFDGFIDSIVRVVGGFAADRSPVHFASKREFGQRLVDLEGRNSSFELTEVTTKIGGNAPITAHALARLGLDVACIGMLGRPRIHSQFAAMDPRATLHSFAEPTETLALEFDDGKVLLAGGTALEAADWATVRDAVGLDRLADLYRHADVVGFANWGELQHATEIWEGIEQQVLPLADPTRRRVVVFDLADPTKRERNLDLLLALVGRLSAHHETIVSLNRNEAMAIARQLGLKAEGSLETLGTALHAAVHADTLIVRDPFEALAWKAHAVSRTETFHNPAPRVSTGGGDNFNAGYCFARLAGFETLPALVVAAAVAGLYVTRGDSPTRPELIDFLHERARLGDAAPPMEAAQ